MVGLHVRGPHLPALLDVVANRWVGRTLVFSGGNAASTIMLRHNVFLRGSAVAPSGSGIHVRVIGSASNAHEQIVCKPARGSEISIHEVDGTLLAKIFLFLGRYCVTSNQQEFRALPFGEATALF